MVKRVIVIVVSVILLVGGALAAIGGGALMAVFGSDNTLTSGTHPVSTPTVALVSALDDIKGTNGLASTVDQPTLRVSVTNSARNQFIGIGPAAAVDRYLAGAAVDKVTDSMSTRSDSRPCVKTEQPNRRRQPSRRSGRRRAPVPTRR